MSFLQRSSAPWMNILSLLVVVEEEEPLLEPVVEEEPLLEPVVEEGARDPLLRSPRAGGWGPEAPSASSILRPVGSILSALVRAHCGLLV